MTEIIAVDVGNSSIDLGRFETHASEQEIAESDGLPRPMEQTRIPLHGSHTPLAAWCERHASAHWFVASVNRRGSDLIQACWETGRSDSGKMTWLSGADIPLRVLVTAPELLGIDRRAAALAANRIRPPDAGMIIVDAGTALTVDGLDGAGTFLGGVILPGMALAAQSLAHGTDRLPKFDGPIECPARTVGRNTEEAIQAGIFWGTIGAIHETVQRVADEIPGVGERVIVTGGAIAACLPHLRFPVEHHPHLVLQGIALAGRARLVS